jgi:hypothetical protein
MTYLWQALWVQSQIRLKAETRLTKPRPWGCTSATVIFAGSTDLQFSPAVGMAELDRIVLGLGVQVRVGHAMVQL